jgi:hypothetical protein
MSKELQNAIKKVREEIDKEKDRLNELENTLASLNNKTQKEETEREAEIRRMFIQD